MKFLPIFMNIKDQPCLVVGGGQIASRKVFMLERAGGKVTVVSPELDPELQQQHQQGVIEYLAKAFEPDDIANQVVIIAATDNEAVNREIAEVAKRNGIPVNVVDAPELCSFIVPSVIDRDPVQIAISTGGASPVLARLLRARLETFIPAAYGRLAKMVESYREKVKQKFSNSNEIRSFWEQVLEGPVVDLLMAGKDRRPKRCCRRPLIMLKHLKPGAKCFWLGPGPEIRIYSPSVPCVLCNKPMWWFTIGWYQRRYWIW